VKKSNRLVLESGRADAEFVTPREATNIGWIKKTPTCDNLLKSPFVTKKKYC